MANCINTCKTELKLNNCGFDHDPADAMVRSQWQRQSKSVIYLLYRWIVGVFVIVIVAISLTEHLQEANAFGLYFIYLTHWGILLNMIVGILGVVLVTIWHFQSTFRVKVFESGKMPTIFQVYWALHNTALVISFVITLVYWSFVYDSERGVTTGDILSHIMNSVIMFVDILIVAHPLRLFHVVEPLCLGILYGIFTCIYYACGGVDPKGEPYVYKILYWGHPGKALGALIGALIAAVFVEIVLFFIYKLRVFIHKKTFAKKNKIEIE